MDKLSYQVAWARLIHHEKLKGKFITHAVIAYNLAAGGSESDGHQRILRELC
jgi:hypothetical protein